MTTAFEVSILGMLAMPFVLCGILGFALWRATRVPPRPPAGDGPPAS